MALSAYQWPLRAYQWPLSAPQWLLGVLQKLPGAPPSLLSAPEVSGRPPGTRSWGNRQAEALDQPEQARQAFAELSLREFRGGLLEQSWRCFGSIFAHLEPCWRVVLGPSRGDIRGHGSNMATAEIQDPPPRVSIGSIPIGFQ